MRELFFVSSYPDRIAYLLDEAEMMTRLGHDVIVITCNRNIRRCNANMTCNKIQCLLCERYTNKLLNKCSNRIKVFSLDSFANQGIKESIEKLSFYYNNIDDIKTIKYHDVNVGYGSLSLYISLTRNLNPLMDSKFRLYFDKLLRDTCYMSVLQEEAIKKINPDRISLFNGRFPEVRGALDYALAHNIELKSCEYTKVFPEFYLKRYFHNSLPHSMSNNVNMINSLWDSAEISDMDKESLGRWFFDSKMNQLFYGDKNYVAGQDKTLLPKEWSDKQINYVIFNSSEDEFVSIGDEYENAKLFKTQYEGIKHIAELLEGNENIHIYLRIHPNLKRIKYRYHTELLELGAKYNNLTVISADSKISSYTLLLKANRIIVFGSTIGVEASYAGKPVINLCKYIYSDLDVVYDPQTIEEADELLLKENLDIKPQIGSLKFGLFYMNPYATSYTFFNINIKHFSLFRHNFISYPLAKLFGSSKLYAILTTALLRWTHKMKLPRAENVN